jgi:hypothetical protein
LDPLHDTPPLSALASTPFKDFVLDNSHHPIDKSKIKELSKSFQTEIDAAAKVRVVMRSVVLCSVVLCSVVLCSVVLCSVVLCSVVLCSAV